MEGFTFQPNTFEPIITAGSIIDQTFVGFDLDLAPFTEFCGDAGIQSFNHVEARSVYPTNPEFVESDFQAVGHFIAARRMADTLKSVSGKETRVTPALTRPVIESTDPIIRASLQYGDFEHEGVHYSPRDPASHMIEQVFNACHHLPDSKRTGFNADTTAGDVNDIDFRYLKISAGGDIVENRQMPLKLRIRTLIHAITDSANDLADGIVLGLVRRVTEVSTEGHLRLVEEDIIGEGIATRAQIDALYVDLPPHPNNVMRDAIRSISGDTQFEYGRAVSARSIRERLDVVTLVFQRLNSYLRSVFKMLKMPKYEGGTTVQLVSREQRTGVLRSEIPQGISGMAFGTMLKPMVYGSRRTVGAMQSTRSEVIALLVDSGVT